jgi:hypothetical protein
MNTDSSDHERSVAPARASRSERPGVWRVAATDSCPVSFSPGVVKRLNHACGRAEAQRRQVPRDRGR